MKEFETGAVRDVGGKGRMDLLPWCALLRVSKHMEDAITPDPETGRSHYPERNWEKGIPMHSMIDSALRHLAKYMDGQKDEDHLCAAATNLLMAMWTEEKCPDMQDIPMQGGIVDNTTSSFFQSACINYSKCEYFQQSGECAKFTQVNVACPHNGDCSRCTFKDD